MNPTDLLKRVVSGQFEAALSMLCTCIDSCPDREWDAPIAKYPFWQVVYHTLCFVDLYLSPDEAAFRTRADLHPKGMDELSEEYPSRRFSKAETLGYLTVCRGKLSEAMAAETAGSLAGPSGMSRLPFSRAELHVHNLRHVQHHTGQLTAHLRRARVDTGWVKTGWH